MRNLRGNGDKALRISDAVTSGNHDYTWPYAPSIAVAGEGQAKNTFAFALDIQPAKLDLQDGVFMDITPGLRGTAVRQGILWVLQDAEDGLTIGWFQAVEDATDAPNTSTDLARIRRLP